MSVIPNTCALSVVRLCSAPTLMGPGRRVVIVNPGDERSDRQIDSIPTCVSSRASAGGVVGRAGAGPEAWGYPACVEWAPDGSKPQLQQAPVSVPRGWEPGVSGCQCRHRSEKTNTGIGLRPGCPAWPGMCRRRIWPDRSGIGVRFRVEAAWRSRARPPGAGTLGGWGAGRRGGGEVARRLIA